MIRFLVLLFLTLACLVLAVLMFNGCDPDPYTGPGEGGACEGQVTKCVKLDDGVHLFVCSVEGQWKDFYNCSKFEMLCDPVIGECVELDAGVDGGAISTFLSHGF